MELGRHSAFRHCRRQSMVNVAASVLLCLLSVAAGHYAVAGLNGGAVQVTQNIIEAAGDRVAPVGPRQLDRPCGGGRSAGSTARRWGGASSPGSPFRGSTRNDPGFVHHGAATLPVIEDAGTRLRLVAGIGWSLAAPVRTPSSLFYADAHLLPGRGASHAGRP